MTQITETKYFCDKCGKQYDEEENSRMDWCMFLFGFMIGGFFAVGLFIFLLDISGGWK